MAVPLSSLYLYCYFFSFNPCQPVIHDDTKASLGQWDSPRIKGHNPMALYSVLSLFSTWDMTHLQTGYYKPTCFFLFAGFHMYNLSSFGLAWLILFFKTPLTNPLASFSDLCANLVLLLSTTRSDQDSLSVLQCLQSTHNVTNTHRHTNTAPRRGNDKSPVQ